MIEIKDLKIGDTIYLEDHQNLGWTVAFQNALKAKCIQITAIEPNLIRFKDISNDARYSGYTNTICTHAYRLIPEIVIAKSKSRFELIDV